MIEYFLMAFFAGTPGTGTATATAPAVHAGAPSQPVQAASQKKEAVSRPVAPADFKNPIQITAERFEIQGRRREAVWAGNVTAVRGPTRLTCDRLVAFYTANQEVTRIECAGNVEAEDGNKWAKGQRADFDNVNGILIVTGTPQARQGATLMEGTKVTFHVGRDLMVVDNARIVLESLPARKKGKK
jgi:lipopolysaccharide export system protein LptA